jgi:hypothetical protein
MSMSTIRTMAIVATGSMFACGCGEDLTSPPYDLTLPTQWSTSVTNRWFPLVPGTRWDYEGETENGTETIVVEVLSETRTVNGVVATIVRDRVYLEGALIEDTYDWYAQDLAGNVWYLGEDSKEIQNGQIVGRSGSWEWGRDGALPGIMMWADPTAHVGEQYRQEYYRGEAEDWGKVIAVGESVTVRAGTFTNCIRTEDWNGLEGRSESLEVKTYCAGVGTVLELPPDSPDERVQLVTRRMGG